MKIRIGFVSNSSSSSFVIGTKGKLTPELVLKAFKIPKDSPLYEIAKLIARSIVGSARETTLEEIVEEDGRLSKEEEELAKKGMTIYKGSFGSDGEGLEAALCEASINFEDEDIIMKHEGGP